MNNYKILDHAVDGFTIIQLTEGKYKDVEFHYGAVAVEEGENETATLKFDYTITKGENINEEEFGAIAGKILHSLIDTQLEKGDVVYAGGVDDRTAS